MRLKRAAILALAIGLVLGLTAVTQAAKPKRVASEVEVTGWIDEPDGDFIIVGDVHANKPKCEKRRTVTLYEQGDPSAERVAFATVLTDKTGDWSYNAGPGDTPDYTSADVDRKQVTKGKKDLVCKADTSPPLVTD